MNAVPIPASSERPFLLDGISKSFGGQNILTNLSWAGERGAPGGGRYRDRLGRSGRSGESVETCARRRVARASLLLRDGCLDPPKPLRCVRAKRLPSMRFKSFIRSASAMFIHRSIESATTNFARDIWFNTFNCNAGAMFASSTNGALWWALGSVGVNVSNTPNSVSRVRRLFMFNSYSPDQ